MPSSTAVLVAACAAVSLLLASSFADALALSSTAALQRPLFAPPAPSVVDGGDGRRPLRRRFRPLPRTPRLPSSSPLSVLRDPAAGDLGIFSGVGSSGRRRTRSEDDVGPSSSADRPPPEASGDLSTFWRAVARRPTRTEDDVVPCEPFLDGDGPLPFGAYRTIGREKFQPRRTCLLTVELVLRPGDGRVLDPESRRPMGHVSRRGCGSGEVGADVAVRNVQGLIDEGFTTFQIADNWDGEEETTSSRESLRWDTPGLREWAEENVYGRLRRETPPSVLRDCHLMTGLKVPPADVARFGNGAAIREMIGASLRRMGGECIDTVQVPYTKDSPYHLDCLNVLFEMQREGIIRSVSGRNFPPSLLASADRCGFHLDMNQVSCNLLDPRPYNEVLSISESVGTKLLIGSPLAGGLLTDRFVRMGADEPNPLFLSASERRHVCTTLQTWAERHWNSGSSSAGAGSSRSSAEIWRQFHCDVLGALGDISHKHQVPASAVALRWALRLNQLGSVVVSSRVGGLAGESDSVSGLADGRLRDRRRCLRGVFLFDLDEEDERRLREASGWRRGGASMLEEDVSRFFDGREFSGAEGELFLPGASSPKLWL